MLRPTPQLTAHTKQGHWARPRIKPVSSWVLVKFVTTEPQGEFPEFCGGFSCFLKGPNLWYMEVPRLGVKSELQLPAYTTATATWDPSHVFDLHHSSWQCQILSPLSKARNRTCILMDPSRVHELLSYEGNFPFVWFFKIKLNLALKRYLVMVLSIFKSSLFGITMPSLCLRTKGCPKAEEKW